MKIEIPGGLIVFMALVNTILLLVALAGFINLKYIIRELKNRIYNLMIEQKQYTVDNKKWYKKGNKIMH